MSDPLALLPFAVAAGAGSIDGTDAQGWVAAGHTLLTRSAPLVRALANGRAGILLPPGGAFLTALAASDGRGAVLINPLAAKPEIVRQLVDAGVTAVFTNAALSGRLPADFPRVLMDEAPRSAFVQVPGREQRVDLGSHFGMRIEGSTDASGREEEAVIIYTSAMAGTPLGAILTHANLISNARVSAEALGDEPRDHCLAALPFAHLFGLVVCACAPLLNGGRVTTMDRFHPGRALEFIEQQQVTRFMGVPSMYAAMLNAMQRRREPIHSHVLRVCLVGGAPVSEQLQERWFNATGIELRQGYGLTEASPAVTLTRADATNERGTMGTAVAATEVSIRHRETGVLMSDECEGEICVRGPHVFRGYVSGGENGLLVHDGWLKTGDLGVKHANGALSFRGLIKPMFTRNGFNIYPREIEDALMRMPGIQFAQAWGVPEAQKENDVAVRVGGAVSETDVKRWAQQQLAAYKVPSHIEIGASQ
ncbi:MAG: AMP-binding protein [Phycisphaerae bacterium]|nr:AMP-binding protein [Gemmatimonadaceae bacterium]